MTVLPRLEAARAGSEELSALVMQALVVPGGSVRQSNFNGAWCVYDGARLWEQRGGWFRPDGWKVTTCVTAALALAERVLPGAQRHLHEQQDGWCVGVGPTSGALFATASSPSPALALCIAILKATTALKADSVGMSEANAPTTPHRKEPG